MVNLAVTTLGRIAGILALALWFVANAQSSFAQAAEGNKAGYLKYLGPLLALKDAGIQYAEDGAGDATILFPPDNKPRVPVIELVRLGSKSFPLLIDCLSDQRVTEIQFRGGSPLKTMFVPLGYVCLDILIGTTTGGPVHAAGCADDGLGACISAAFYFRPDDYARCSSERCVPRPRVLAVQRNWRGLYMRKQIRFEDPYRQSRE